MGKTAAQAALDGITMAVGASAAKVGWQVVVNVATSVISGIMNEDDGMEIACQAAVSGVFAYVGGNGTDFAGKSNTFRNSMEKIYGASSAASKGYSGYMGRFIGYERRYNGKCTIIFQIVY